MKRQRRPNGISFALGSVMLLALGCAEPNETAESPGRRNRTEDRNRPPELVYAELFVDTYLLSEDRDFRWRFLDRRFVLESHRRPLPASVTGAMFDEPDADYRVEGAWTLSEDRRRLELTDLSADLGRPRESASLELEFTAADRMTLGGVSYAFSDSLPLQEVLRESTYLGHVIEVSKGDRVVVRDENGEVHRVRMLGIACPGIDQPHGAAAKEFSKEMTGDHEVRINVFRVDDAGLESGQVIVGYRYLNLDLLTEGLAWHDKREDNEWIFATAEDDARVERRGLWADDSPVPPWHEVGVSQD